MNLKGFTKGLILDFDGVIIDSTEQSIQEHQRFAQLKGYPVPDYEQLRQLWGLPWINITMAIWPISIAKSFMEEYIKDYMKSGVKNRDFLFPNALSSLAKLKEAGLLISLLTSRDQETLALHLNNAAIPSDIFFFIQAPNGYSLQGPEPKTFRPTLEQFERIDIAKENLVYVADTLYDLQAAQAAQIKFIGVPTGAATEKEFKEAGVQNIIESIADLPSFLGL